MLKLPSASVKPESHCKIYKSKLIGFRFTTFDLLTDLIINNPVLEFSPELVLKYLFLNLISIIFLGTIVINPCSPVLAKKALPKTESAIVNPASLYSKYCKPVNSIANIIVMIVP
jgi:hypothetical protein